MNRNEFMKQLEALLQNISQAEREEALQYYNDYFDDAGPENEQSVIEALGNPARVAENIKRDLYANGYATNGYDDYSQSVSRDKAVIPYGQKGEESPNNGAACETTEPAVAQAQIQQSNSGNKKTGKKMSTEMIILIIILVLFASPILLSVGAGIVTAAVGILTGLLGLIIGWFGVIFGFGVAAVALFIVFVILAAVGTMVLFTEPLVGVALIGGGLVCGGIGILFMMLTVAMAGIVTPAICKGIIDLFQKLSNKLRDKKESRKERV